MATKYGIAIPVSRELYEDAAIWREVREKEQEKLLEKLAIAFKKML